MKLENQVVFLDLTKKLKELGVEQKSHFFWQYEKLIDNAELMDNWHFLGQDNNRFEYFVAFTVATIHKFTRLQACKISMY